ncbi:DUF814 domain-containing protein [Desulfothermus naphthae]
MIYYFKRMKHLSQPEKKIKSQYHALALFSGGLDSILAIKLIQQQGLDVLGIHFFSPFFGNLEKVPQWEQEYKIDILPIEVSSEYFEIIKNPKYGRGKALNPCIDCKIYMFKKVKELMPLFNAKFIITGEVVGQRPMSQRQDSMNIIIRESKTNEFLLRPLSAKNLKPTRVEEEGIVDRSKLLDIRGRSRKRQLDLAKQFHIMKIPTPAGGCLLTDPQMAKRFKPIFNNKKSLTSNDFLLVRYGRQFWSDKYWFIVGRNHEDNLKLLKLANESDYIFKLIDIPGPIGIGRSEESKWPTELIISAAKLIVWYSKARVKKGPLNIHLHRGSMVEEFQILPDNKKPTLWRGPL